MNTMNYIKCAAWLLQCRKIASFAKGLLTLCTILFLLGFGASLFLQRGKTGRQFKKLLKKVRP